MTENAFPASGEGALAGIRVVEFAGLGPGPFAGMMLADHGAEVICIRRPNAVTNADPSKDVLSRSRRSIAIDLSKPEGVRVALDIASSCDALIEGFRPGVMERLGLGPEVLLELNPRLVYGRMTGWGQTGPMAQLAGHDINYIALSGALFACRRAGQKPTPPVNWLGDFGGGGMLLAFGILAGILSARMTHKGQVVDAAMTEGSALLTSMMWGMRAQGRWNGEPGTNFLDTGSHFYDTYETKDGGFIALGAIEPQFYAQMRRAIGLVEDPEFDGQMESQRWPAAKEKLTQLIKMRTRAEWCAAFEGYDACFAPVLGLDEAAAHPHNRERGSFIEANGVCQPAPAPRFTQSGTVKPRMPERVAGSEENVLQSFGYDIARIAQLREAGIVRSSA